MLQFKKDIQYKIDHMQLELVKNNVPDVFVESIEAIMKSLLSLNNKIEQDLKKENWKEILTRIQTTFGNIMTKQKSKIISTLETLSDNLNKLYLDSFDIINKFKNTPGCNFELSELKIFISDRLGEKNNYEEAITNIMSDILSDSKYATNWKNSSGIVEYIKCIFTDKAYLKKTTDIMMNSTSKRLNNFKNIINKLIKEYMDIILNIVDIEKNSLINYFEEKKRRKDNEEQERKMKWKLLCQEFNQLEQKMKEFISNNIFIDNQIMKDNEIK